MFLRTAISVTLFASLLGAADIFSVRSFRHPETKAKIPVTAQLFATGGPKLMAAPPTEKCSIPLLQAKPGKVHDNMTRFAGPNPDLASITPPPVPACKNWK